MTARAQKMPAARQVLDKAMAATSEGEATLLRDLDAVGLLPPEREFRFNPIRRWRFDFAWPSLKVAVEIEGGTFSGGRHSRGRGYEADLEKYNSATFLGWSVYRFTTEMVERGDALAVMEYVLR